MWACHHRKTGGKSEMIRSKFRVSSLLYSLSLSASRPFLRCPALWHIPSAITIHCPTSYSRLSSCSGCDPKLVLNRGKPGSRIYPVSILCLLMLLLPSGTGGSPLCHISMLYLNYFPSFVLFHHMFIFHSLFFRCVCISRTGHVRD